MKPSFELKVGGDLLERREAVFSVSGKYRYLLRIVWNETLPLCQFIGLNPSTADESQDDPTLRRCKSFARRWGHGGLLMTNVFAFRATDPDVMMRQIDPVGPNNHDFILEAAKQCSTIVAAWGNDGAYGQWGFHVQILLQNAHHRVHCFKFTKTGQPYHPLYVSGDTPLQPYMVQL